MTLAHALFRRGLLPAHSRRTFEIPYSLQHREPCLFGLMSRFAGLNIEFVRYLNDHGVVWRLALKTRKIRDYNLIKVFTDNDAEIVRNAFELEDFTAGENFTEELRALGYRFIHRGSMVANYRVFNRAQMMDLLLRFDWTKPSYFVTFDK